MIDRLFSPESRARPTKSRETNEKVCARIARMAQVHVVHAISVPSMTALV